MERFINAQTYLLICFNVTEIRDKVLKVTLCFSKYVIMDNGLIFNNCVDSEIAFMDLRIISKRTKEMRICIMLLW